MRAQTERAIAEPSRDGWRGIGFEQRDSGQLHPVVIRTIRI